MDRRIAFSAKYRSDFLSTMENVVHDIVVIGGGITGAGIALDAASRGLKVALVEKGDFASGTSGKSTKLIHGGLRYLKQFEFGLVKEVGQERAILHRLAPHIVIPEKMILPLIKGGSLGKTMTSIGLYIYDFLAEVEDDDKRKMLNREEILAIEPMLPVDKLLGGSIYAEYRTDDARLTIEVMKTAHRHGAICLNYLECTDFIKGETGVEGIVAKDLPTGKQIEIKARKVVNAAGPWVDEIRSMDEAVRGKRLYLTKGVHIVVPRRKLPVQHAIYFDVPGDNRMIFAIPRLQTTYIGTTDTYYNGDKNDIQVTQEDATYLLNAVNLTFGNLGLTESDIISSWAGVRPLIYEDGKSASEISRKDEIFESGDGLISIAGGKLTGYRKMAERVVDLVCKRLSREGKDAECVTDKIPLTEPGFKSYQEVMDFSEEVTEKLEKLSLPSHLTPYLVQNYGAQVLSILEKIDGEPGDAEMELIRQEMLHCCHHEMVMSPFDYLIRRSGRLYFIPDSITSVEKVTAEVWDEIFDGSLLPYDPSLWNARLADLVSYPKYKVS